MLLVSVVALVRDEKANLGETHHWLLACRRSLAEEHLEQPGSEDSDLLCHNAFYGRALWMC